MDRSERRIYWVIGGLVGVGILVMVVGFFMWLMAAGGGALAFLRSQGSDRELLAASAVGPAVSVFGGLMALGGLGLGLWYVKVGQHAGVPLLIDPATVIARFSIGRDGSLVDSSLIDAHDDDRLYVRLKLSYHDSGEYTADYPVWIRCGEGIQGRAVVQGRRLVSFDPYTAMAPPAQEHPRFDSPPS